MDAGPKLLWEGSAIDAVLPLPKNPQICRLSLPSLQFRKGKGGMLDAAESQKVSHYFPYKSPSYIFIITNKSNYTTKLEFFLELVCMMRLTLVLWMQALNGRPFTPNSWILYRRSRIGLRITPCSWHVNPPTTGKAGLNGRTNTGFPHRSLRRSLALH